MVRKTITLLILLAVAGGDVAHGYLVRLSAMRAKQVAAKEDNAAPAQDRQNSDDKSTDDHRQSDLGSITPLPAAVIENTPRPILTPGRGLELSKVQGRTLFGSTPGEALPHSSVSPTFLARDLNKSMAVVAKPVRTHAPPTPS